MKNKVTASALLGGLMEPLGRCLTTASAHEILGLRADATAEGRIKDLADKCDQGRLTPVEQAEYQFFVEVGDMVALLQAKARRYLAEHPGT